MKLSLQTRVPVVLVLQVEVGAVATQCSWCMEKLHASYAPLPESDNGTPENRLSRLCRQ